MKRPWWCVSVGCASLVLTAGSAMAQQDFSLSLLDRGKPVRAEVRVENETRTTDAVGTVSFPLALLDSGKRVEVWEYRCVDGEMKYVVVPAGTEPADEEGCRKRRVGGFLWGEGSPVIQVGGPATGLDSFTIGAGFDLRQMYKLDDVIGEVPGVTEHDATMWAPGFQLLAEIRALSFLALGVEGGWSTMTTETQFNGIVQEGDINYYELGGYARLCAPGPRRIVPYGIFGLYRTWNKADFTVDGLAERRVHKTRRDGIGAGVEYWPRNNLGLRFEGMYNTTFEDGDADEHIRWKLGMMFRPFAQRSYDAF